MWRGCEGQETTETAQLALGSHPSPPQGSGGVAQHVQHLSRPTRVWPGPSPSAGWPPWRDLRFLRGTAQGLRDPRGPHGAEGRAEPSCWPSWGPRLLSSPTSSHPWAGLCPRAAGGAPSWDIFVLFCYFKNSHLFCVGWRRNGETMIIKVTCSLGKSWKIQKSTKKKPHRSPPAKKP